MADQSDFRSPRHFWYENMRRDIQSRRRKPNSRTMVPARRRNDTAFGDIKRQQRIERPACLEAPGVLDVLKLQLDRARHAWRIQSHDRGAPNMPGDPIPGSDDLVSPIHTTP